MPPCRHLSKAQIDRVVAREGAACAAADIAPVSNG